MPSELEQAIKKLADRWRSDYPLSVDMDHSYGICADAMWNCANEIYHILDSEEGRPQVDASLEDAVDSAAFEIVDSDDVSVTIYDIILKHITPVVNAMVQAAAVEMQERAALKIEELNHLGPYHAIGGAGYIRSIATPTDALDRMLREREATARLEELTNLVNTIAQANILVQGSMASEITISIEERIAAIRAEGKVRRSATRWQNWRI